MSNEKRETVSAEDLTIRSPRSEDTRRLGDIAVAAWGPVYASFRSMMGDEIFTRVYPDWQSDKRAQVEDYVVAAPECFFVTELDGAVVGFIAWSLDRQKKIGEISNNAVDPRYQGRGIGTVQYRRVLDHFRREGMEIARVMTGLDESHTAARRAYEKAGFDHRVPIVTMYMKL